MGFWHNDLYFQTEQELSAHLMTAMCVSAVYSYHFLYLQENMTGAFLKHFLIRMFSPFKFQFSAVTHRTMALCWLFCSAT